MDKVKTEDILRVRYESWIFTLEGGEVWIDYAWYPPMSMFHDMLLIAWTAQDHRS